MNEQKSDWWYCKWRKMITGEKLVEDDDEQRVVYSCTQTENQEPKCN